MKAKFKKNKTFKYVTFVSIDELRYVKNSFLNSSGKNSEQRKMFIKRQLAINKWRLNQPVQLCKREIVWLYEYWVQLDFDEKGNLLIQQRLDYLEMLIGKKEAKILHIKFSKRMHEQNLFEDKEAWKGSFQYDWEEEDIQFPTSWYDSDFAANN